MSKWAQLLHFIWGKKPADRKYLAARRNDNIFKRLGLLHIYRVGKNVIYNICTSRFAFHAEACLVEFGDRGLREMLSSHAISTV